MKMLRKIIGVLLAVTWVVFALPSIAATKSQSATLVPAQIAVGVPTVVTLTVNNISPPSGNSTINSIIITPPNSGFTISNVTPAGACVLSGSQIKCNGFTGIRPGASYPVSFKVTTTTTAGCFAANWQVYSYAGNSWSGDVFLPSPAIVTMKDASSACFYGSASCGQTPVTLADETVLARGLYNKDGACNLDPVVSLPYIWSNNADGSRTLTWDTTSSGVPSAAFAFKAFDDPVAVDTTTTPGWPANTARPLVGWEFTGTSRVPDNIYFAVACVGNSLPAPYGSLASAVTDVATAISVTVTVPTGSIPMPAFPFAIQIGKERLKVTNVAVTSSTTATLTVERGDGHTSATAHSNLSYVMSNPLPIDPNALKPNGTTNLRQGYQAQMCIADRGWTVYGYGTNGYGTQLVRWWSHVFDIGDGWYSVGE